MAPSPSSDTGLRERKRLATRSGIIERAFDLFEARGYEHVTVEEIAEAAGISPRTVYRYFSTKAEIVFAVQTDWMTAFRDATADGQPDTPVTVEIRRVCLAVAAVAMRGRADALRAFRLGSSSPDLTNRDFGWVRAWQHAAENLVGARGIDHPDVVAGIVMGMINATVIDWLRAGARQDLVAMIDRGFDLVESGLATLNQPR